MKTLKTIAILLLVFTQTALFAQRVKGNQNFITTNRSTSDYEKIVVAGSFDVILVSGTEGKLTIEIESNLEEFLVTEVKNGILKIRWEKGMKISSKKTVKITVPFKDINAVSLAGSGNITSKNTIKANNLKLKLAGSGDLNLSVEARNIESAIAGSGNMKISGSSNTIESRISGSGDIEAYNLKVDTADFKISGSGTIEAYVNKKLNARISGSGDIYYKGKPITDVKVSGSGSVSMQ